MAAKAYAEQLSVLRNGTALWQPIPLGGSTFERVRVGDVGYVSLEGRFQRLLNVILTRSEQPHLSFKYDHEPLPIPPSVELDQHLFYSPTNYKAECGEPGDPDMQPYPDLAVTFHHEVGAAILLQKGAVRQDIPLDCRPIFRDYMLRNCRFFKYLTEASGKHISLSDLILVTGIEMTSQCDLFTFNRSDSECMDWLNIGYEADGKFVVRSEGEDPKLIQYEQSCRTDSVDKNRDPVLDLCLFVRGFRMKQRFEGPSPFEPNPINIINPLLDYMLQHSRANYVIAHDDDIAPYISPDLSTTRHNIIYARPQVEVVEALNNNFVGLLIQTKTPIEADYVEI